MYTINGAYTMRQEDLTGSLSVGKKADFIVLDKDIFLGDITPDDIKNTVVYQTIVDGKEIFRHNMFD
jgi:predicted amidohydrolase YtcJ